MGRGFLCGRVAFISRDLGQAPAPNATTLAACRGGWLLGQNLWKICHKQMGNHFHAIVIDQMASANHIQGGP
jgi:hypothetical protein